MWHQAASTPAGFSSTSSTPLPTTFSCTGSIWARYGAVTLIGLALWLRVIGVGSLLFVFAVWFTLGQASGAYVSPKTWTVLFLAAAIARLRRRQTLYLSADGTSLFRESQARRAIALEGGRIGAVAVPAPSL